MTEQEPQLRCSKCNSDINDEHGGVLLTYVTIVRSFRVLCIPCLKTLIKTSHSGVKLGLSPLPDGVVFVIRQSKPNITPSEHMFGDPFCRICHKNIAILNGFCSTCLGSYRRDNMSC